MDFPKLIELFATNKVAGINSVAEYIELCRQNTDNRQFQLQRDAVEAAKTELEELLDNQPDNKSQILAALNMLHQHREFHFDLFYGLIREGYKREWSQPQQMYFESEVMRIRSGNDYFLSFTTRSLVVVTNGYNRINKRYQYYINHQIGTENIRAIDRRTKNLLAEALRAQLADSNLKGFFFTQHENDNAIVKEKLSEGCRGARVFIQLVQNVMFVPPNGGRSNYCEFEYREAMKFMQDDKHILFVVAEERDGLEKPDRVHKPYQTWLEHVLKKAVPYLPPADTYDKKRIEEIRNQVSDVVSRVKAAKRGALELIPD